MGLSEQRNYRKFTAKQKLEIVLAGLRGDRSVRDLCREHEISAELMLDLDQAAKRSERRAVLLAIKRGKHGRVVTDRGHRGPDASPERLAARCAAKIVVTASR